MLRFCDWTTLRLLAQRGSRQKSLSAALVGVVLLLPSFARAATIDFDVPSGNYDSALDPGPPHFNWIDSTQAEPVAPPAVPPTNTPVSIPGPNDDAYIRNGGTATITSDIVNNSLSVGAAHTLYTDDGVNIIETETGGDGTVNMTGGSITGVADVPNSRYGTRIFLGDTGLNGEVWTGIFNQSGGKINMNVGSSSGNTSSALVIGNGSASDTPTSVFTLSGTGEIGMVYDAGGHRGINVRSGTFNMTGGLIYNEEAVGVGLYNQQFMQVSSTSGTNDNPNKAYANFSGGTVDVHHGLRVAPNNRSAGYVTISGTASLKLGNDLQLAANNGGSGNNPAYGQLDMSGGYLQVGQPTTTAGTYEKKFIVGDNGTGVYNQTGGTVLVGDQLRMTNSAASSAVFTMKDPSGGPTGVPFSFTARNVETRNSATLDATLSSDVIIDSPDATFTQTNLVNPGTGSTITGSTSIGGQGKSLFEIRQGNVLLGQTTGGGDFGGNIDLSKSGNSRATLNLIGGKLTLGGNLNRSDTSAASVPNVNLTGGQLVLNPLTSTPTTQNWQTDFTNAGSQITTGPGAKLTVLVGAAGTHPGNFEMDSGSWNLDIDSGIGFLANGSDRFVVNSTAGAGNLLGGTLNLNYLSGYVPAIGDSRTIVRVNNSGTVSLNAGAVMINAPGSDPNWTLQTVVVSAAVNDIRLVYVPEPASCVLMVAGLAVGMIVRRRRS